MARSVGLPGVIAHGMYTMALAARAVAEWFPGAEVVSLGLQVHQPGRGPGRGRRRRSRSPARPRSRSDGLTDGRAHRDLRRPEGARHAQGRRSRRLSMSRLLSDHTTLRLGWPGARVGDRDDRDRADRGPRHDRSGAGARRRQQPRGRGLGFRRPGRRGRHPRGHADPTPTTPLRRRAGQGRGGGELGRPRRARGRARLGRASRRWPASRVGSGATPIQNVGAYGQEVAQTIAHGPGLGPRPSRGCAPSPTPTAASATGPRASRRTRTGTSSSTSRSSSPSAPWVPRSPTPSWPAALGVEQGAARPAGRGPRGGPGAAPRQGDGPRPRRPRHLERRVVLHQPGPRGHRRPGGRACVAAGRRARSRPVRPG